MSLKLYLTGMILGTILCLVSTVLIILYIDPEESRIFGPAVLLTSLFLGLTGFFTVCGFYMRLFFSKNEVVFNHISPAFRQGVLLSLVFVVLILLELFRILNVWAALLLIGAIILFEFYFLSR